MFSLPVEWFRLLSTVILVIACCTPYSCYAQFPHFGDEVDTSSMVERWKERWEEAREHRLKRSTTYVQRIPKGRRRVDSEYTYDQEGKWLTRRKALRAKRFGYTTWTYTYGENGLMDSMIVGNSRRPENESIWTYVYDENNRLVEMNYFSNDGRLMQSRKWTYLPNGKRATETSFREKEFFYDAMGRLILVKEADRTIQEWIYDPNDRLTKVRVQGHAFVYTWNEIGQNIHTALYETPNEEGATVKQECDYKYDENGLLIEENCSAGEFGKAARFVDEYDEKGLLIRTIVYSKGGRIKEVYTKEYERYTP